MGQPHGDGSRTMQKAATFCRLRPVGGHGFANSFAAGLTSGFSASTYPPSCTGVPGLPGVPPPHPIGLAPPSPPSVGDPGTPPPAMPPSLDRVGALPPGNVAPALPNPSTALPANPTVPPDPAAPLDVPPPADPAADAFWPSASAGTSPTDALDLALQALAAEWAAAHGPTG